MLKQAGLLGSRGTSEEVSGGNICKSFPFRVQTPLQTVTDFSSTIAPWSLYLSPLLLIPSLGLHHLSVSHLVNAAIP